MDNLEALLNEAATVDTAKAAEVIKADKKAKKQAASKAAETQAAEVKAEEKTVSPVVTVEGDLSEMIKSITEENAAMTKASVLKQFDDRANFELDNGGTDKKLDLLKSYAGRLSNDSVVKVLAALKFDTGFVNQQRGSKRYNVYAVDKVADIAAALAGVAIRNKVNNAIVRSLFACRAAGLEFTGLIADAAVSDKVRVQDHIKKVLVRHSVSESTVDTQRSSTMSALQLFGVVENVGSRNAPVWRLTDTPQTRALEERLAA